MAEAKRLSRKSVTVLSLIAEGHSYAQIVNGHPEISYRDIFAAAEEALRLQESPSDYQVRLAKLKERSPKAYERWTAEEDADLAKAFRTGVSVEKLGKMFQRQTSA